MTVKQIEQAIERQYDAGRYRSTGADGGVLRYIMVNVDGTWYNASITLDSEIAAIRRIWELHEVTEGNKRIRRIYDYTKQYYDMRRAG